MSSEINPALALLATLMSLQGKFLEPKIPKPPILSDGEIRKGKKIENGLEFGDLLFRGVIGEPFVTFSGLVYSYNEKKEICYTELPSGLVSPNAAP